MCVFSHCHKVEKVQLNGNCRQQNETQNKNEEK